MSHYLRRTSQYEQVTCKDCGWDGPYILVHAASRTDPSYLAKDHPTECEECGSENFDYDTYTMSLADMRDDD